MVDRIKFIIKDYNPKEEKLLWKEENKLEVPYKSFFISKLYNPNSNKKKFPLKLLLTANEKTEKFNLSISGNLRKWYFNSNSRKDLNFKEYEECIKLIASELGVDFETLLVQGKLTELELGITVLLKSELRNINNCFVKYRNSERQVFNKTTLYFHFGNYKMVLYDKFLEMNNNKIQTKEKVKIYNKFHLFRFEINIDKVSGTILKGKLDTLGKVLENWNTIPLLIEKYINDIIFVDVISKEKNIEINSYPDLMKYFTFIGIKEYGITESIGLFESVKSSNKSKMMKGFLDIFRNNITEETNAKVKLLIEVKKKLSRLYNKSNIQYNKGIKIIKYNTS